MAQSPIDMALQSLSVSLQRSNALAIARRAPGASPPLSDALYGARAQLRFVAAGHAQTSQEIGNAVYGLQHQSADAATAAPPPVAGPAVTPSPPTPAPAPTTSPPAAGRPCCANPACGSSSHTVPVPPCELRVV